MSTATLAGLKQLGFFIRYVTDPKYADILANHPLVDELVLVPAGSRNEIIAETKNLLPASKYIYFYYPFYVKQDLPSHSIPIHLCDYYCTQADVYPSDALSVGLTAEQVKHAEKYRDKVLVHSESRWSPYKNWPLDRWSELAGLLRRKCGIEVMQIGSGIDKPIEGVEKIITPSILEAVAAIDQCKLFLGIDSVFNHASRAVKKASIIIWGSTHPNSFGYRQNLNLVNGVAWQKEMGLYGPTLHCQPCYREYPDEKRPRNPCPYTLPHPCQTLPRSLHRDSVVNACMSSTTVDVVYHHAARMLSNPDYLQTLEHAPFKKNRII